MSKDRPIFPIEVGTRVVMAPQGNIARDNKSPAQGTVVRLGRTYFYVQKDGSPREEKFEKKSFINHHEDCNSEYILWPSQEAYAAHLQLIQRRSAIERVFRSMWWDRRLSEAAVNKIYELLDCEGCFKER